MADFLSRKVSTPYTPAMNNVLLLKQGMGVEEADVEKGAIQTLEEETSSDIITEKTVQVTDEEQHIDLEGYGLRLHIHQNSLPENCSQFQLKMAVSRAKVCTLPTENGILVSAVYSFNHNLGDRKLRRPASLEMQHCVVGGSNYPLFIVQSNEISPPFVFREGSLIRLRDMPVLNWTISAVLVSTSNGSFLLSSGI